MGFVGPLASNAVAAAVAVARGHEIARAVLHLLKKSGAQDADRVPGLQTKLDAGNALRDGRRSFGRDMRPSASALTSPMLKYGRISTAV